MLSSSFELSSFPSSIAKSANEISKDEQSGLLALLERAKTDIQIEFSPDGYNIGINDGSAAGQTVPHLHMHLIPRYKGDQEDPRGGVRWVIPGKAKYWD